MIWWYITFYDIIWYDMLRHAMIWYDMIWCDMIWYDMISYDIIWHDTIWYDMIWYDMIWYDMIWYNDTIWYDMSLVAFWRRGSEPYERSTRSCRVLFRERLPYLWCAPRAGHDLDDLQVLWPPACRDGALCISWYLWSATGPTQEVRAKVMQIERPPTGIISCGRSHIPEI